MFRLDPELKVYLHREAVDFRKNINGLATLVEQSLGLDPFARAVYVFRNRRADRIKLLGEPPRVSRRLKPLRRWSHEEVSEFFPRGPRACRAHGVGTPGRA